MEIVPIPSDEQNADIAQLKGTRNASPDADVFRAAHAWLAQRGRYPFAGANRTVHARRW